jgi:hypothetical protein
VRADDDWADDDWAEAGGEETDGPGAEPAHCRWRVQTVVKGIWRRVTEAGGEPASPLAGSRGAGDTARCAGW